MRTVFEITVVFPDGRFMTWNTLDERLATARLTAWLTSHPAASVDEPTVCFVGASPVLRYRIKVPS